MRYVDGFVLPVPAKNLLAYRRMARRAGRIWMEYGALEFVECVGDDISDGKCHFPFDKMAKAKRGEAVVFSFIVYKSKADRNRIYAQVMKDPRLAKSMQGKGMPFDWKRMAHGGFRAIVDL